MEEAIHFLDLKKQYISIKKEIITSIEETLDKAEFSGGENIQKFEGAFAKLCGTKFCVALNNGTSALHLAMVVNEIQQGDEVIIPANTFIATAWAPVYVGAKPVFVDCDPHTWNISAEDLGKKITSKTKAIIGVHLYGQPFNYDEIKNVADRHQIKIIEDCAQAHGALYKGKEAGSLGTVGCFSFYPSKNLSTYGEGGAVTTNDEGIYEKLFRLRNNGSASKYEHVELGYNYRMGGMEAAVLNVKLKYLIEWNFRRQEIAKRYLGEITNRKIKFQQGIDDITHVWHLFVVTTENRNLLITHLKKHNIFAGIHYPMPCHLQEAFSYLRYKKGELPNSEFLADHCLSLPMYPELSDLQIGKVIEVINKY